MINTKVIELIKDFCETGDDEYRFYSDYRGRGMFGRRCIGLTCDDPMKMLVKLCDFLHENDTDNVADALGNICMDNMGCGCIVYFTGLSV